MTICNVCTLNLRQANNKLQADPELLERVNKNLREVGAASYSGGVEVRHLLWEIAEGDGYEKLKQIAAKPLTGVRIAPFYGCQILRPSKLLGFEDPDRPQSLERIIEACGAEPVDYPSKIKCCGFPIVLAREEVALGELIQPLVEAKAGGRRRDGDALPAVPPVAGRLAGQGEHARRTCGSTCRSCTWPSWSAPPPASSYDELLFKRHVVQTHPFTDKVYAGQR